MDIRKEVETIFPLLVEQRRYLHAHPELSRQEDNTVAYIMKQLESFGFEEIIEIPDGGVIAYVRGGKAPAEGKKTILLRADIDALPVLEPEMNLSQPRTCRSENEGVMHACGHDGHTSMLLGAAKLLHDHRDELCGDVLCCFERGEEGGGNINDIMAYFFAHGVKYDRCFGMHVEPGYEAGTFGVSPGNADAAGIGISYKITSKGGHGSRPDLANNAIDILVEFINQINLIRLKTVSPFDNFTVAVCKVTSGTKGNIIPDTAELEGTARFFNHAAKQKFMDRIEEIRQAMEKLYGCTIENRVGRAPGNPLLNDEASAMCARRAAEKLIGAENLLPQAVTMGSESFGRYMEIAPGCYGNLGVANAAKGCGAWIHDPYFDLDEDALKVGCGMHIAMAYEYLNNED